MTALDRDRYADLLRALALAAVVVGHWTMAAVFVGADGEVQVGNALSGLPALHVLTWIFQLVPLFFFVGGVANATACRRNHEAGAGFVPKRLRGLLPPAGWLALGAAIGAAALFLIGVPTDLVLQALLFVVLPLWFLAVYVPLVVLTPVLLRLHERYGMRIPVLLIAMAALFDIARHITGRTEFGWPNVLIVWALAHQLGFAYRDGILLQVPRRWLLTWALGAFAALVAATASPVWPTSMVGLPGEESNMAPPGIPVLCLVLLQVPLALLLRPRVLPLLAQPLPSRLIDLAASRSMSAFLWHLPVLVGFIGTLLLLDVPLPVPGSAWWWLTRPIWLGVLALLLIAVLSVSRPRSPDMTSSSSQLTAGGPHAPRAAKPFASGILSLRYWPLSRRS